MEERLINEVLMIFGPILALCGIAIITWRKRLMRASLNGQRSLLGPLGNWAANRTNPNGNVLIIAGAIWTAVGIAMTISAAIHLST